MLKQFFKDSFIYGLSNVISRGLALILLPLYTQVFSPADYGVIEILSIVASLVNLTVALEISQAVVLYYADAETESDKVAYVSTALWFSMAMYGLFVLVALGFSEHLSSWILESSSSQFIFQIAVLSMWSTGIFYFLQNQLRWQLLPKYYAVSSILFTLVSAGTTVTLVLVFDSGVIGVFYGLLVGGIIGGAMAWYFARRSYELIFNWRKCKELLSFSSPLVPSGIAVFLYLYIDRFAIKELMTLSDVGLFGVGYRIASVVYLILFGFESALTALVFHNYRKATTPNELARIFRYFLVLILPVIVGIAMFSLDVLRIFTTPVYYPAWQVIPLLAVAILLFNMIIFAPGLELAKKTPSIAVISVATALLNMALNFALIPLLGISGAALATLTSAAVSFSLYMILSQKLYFVPHEWGKLAISIGIALILSLLGLLLGTGTQLPATITVLFRVLLMVGGIVLLAWLLIGAQEVRSLMKDLARKAGASLG
jgi:O-antigen/teichoic acid export membrane protein